jgi:hypothetical protein
MPVLSVKKIERLAGDGRTLAFMIRPASRSRPGRWFKVHEVPDFEGDWAWFECVRIKGGWKVLRRAPKEPGRG